MKKISVSEFVRKNMAWVILAVILALFSFTPNFLSFQNIINILAQNAYVVIASLGVTFAFFAASFA